MTSILNQLGDKPIATATKINNKRIRIPPRVTLGEFTEANIGTLKKLCNVLFPISFSDKFYKDVLDLNLSPEEYNKLVFYQDLAVGNLVSRLELISSPLPTTLNSSVSPSSTTEPIASTSSASPSTPSKSSSTATPVKVLNDEPYKLYIMTLGVLAPYRKQGLATKLIQQIITSAESSHYPIPPSSIKIKQPTTEDVPTDKKKKLSISAEKEREAKEKAEAEAASRRPKVFSIYCHVQEGNEDGIKFWLSHGFVIKGKVENYYRKITPRTAILMERSVTPKEPEVVVVV